MSGLRGWCIAEGVIAGLCSLTQKLIAGMMSSRAAVVLPCVLINGALRAPLLTGLLGRPGLLRPAGHGGGIPAAAPLAHAGRCALLPAVLRCGSALQCCTCCTCSALPLAHSPTTIMLCSCSNSLLLTASGRGYGSSKGKRAAAEELEGSLGVLLVDFFRLYGRALNNQEVGAVYPQTLVCKCGGWGLADVLCTPRHELVMLAAPCRWDGLRTSSRLAALMIVLMCLLASPARRSA